MSATVRRDPRADALSASSARRFAQRSRRRRWRTWWPLLSLLTAIALLATAGWLVLASSVFAVKTVAVKGTRSLSGADVTAAADVPLGRPLARLDLAAARARVGALDRVAAVSVRRRWPSTVAIDVVERVPVAVVSAAGRYRVVDRGGIAFDAAPGPVAGLPVITLRDGSPATRRPSPALVSALAIVHALPPSVATHLTEVLAVTGEDVRLTLDGGRTVRWGGPARSARKAAVLAALLHRPARVYDVSAPDAPTTRGRR